MNFKNNKIIKRNEIIKLRDEHIKKYIKMIEQKKEENEIIKNYNLLNKCYLLKSNYNSIIPLHLYTCWHTKDLPPLMRENFNYIVESNPLISFHLFDELDCREFIQKNFEEDVLQAYDGLIPCSYKSDLWRYCVLYINGGIYMDIKYRCKNNFKFISLTEKEHFVRDKNPSATYTALIVTLPNNTIILEFYENYREEQSKYQKNKHYGDLWREKNIYNN
jgi:mannosyltransferase OCH1-like enzyme